MSAATVPQAGDPQHASEAQAGAARGGASVMARLGLGRAEAIAGAATVAWFVLALVFRLLSGPDEGSVPASVRVMGWVALLLPVAMIWLAALIARASRELRAEAARLAATVEALRQSGAPASPAVASPGQPVAAAERAAELLSASAEWRDTQSLPVRFTSRREAAEATVRPATPSAAAVPAEAQAALALGTPPEVRHAPVEAAEFIRALNFPDDAEDAEGFRALRRALQDRRMAKLIRAAQDVLTLLAQDGIYMDDLAPDRARPEVWRRFAAGERGREIAALGGVRDRSSLALSAGRMRQDAIFRDAAHHFLRQFDHSFAELEKVATDVEIVDLAGTRTARAFMLLGRVTGIFD